MKTLKLLSIFLLISLASFSCGGGENTPPTTTVSGTVHDIQGHPLEGADITISTDPVAVMTDVNGYFIATVEVGDHKIVINKGSEEVYSQAFICFENTLFSMGNIITSYNPNNDIDNDGDNYMEYKGDCNDSDTSINPGATEICKDNIDQDCDGDDLVCPDLPSMTVGATITGVDTISNFMFDPVIFDYSIEYSIQNAQPDADDNTGMLWGFLEFDYQNDFDKCSIPFDGQLDVIYTKESSGVLTGTLKCYDSMFPFLYGSRMKLYIAYCVSPDIERSCSFDSIYSNEVNFTVNKY